MRPKPLILLALLLAIGGATLWATRPAMQPVTAGVQLAVAQTSPLLTPEATPQPTPLPPVPTPAITMQAEADWQTYTSPYLGFSFRHPPNRRVEGPEISFERVNVSKNADYSNLIGPPTSIFPAPGKLGAIGMILHAYTRLPATSLADWALLYNRFSGMNGMWGFSPIELATIPADYLPEGIDQGIYTVNDWPYNPAKIIWLQRGDFVYSFASTYNRPEDIALILAMIKSLEFDPAMETTLRASNGFQGDDEYFRQQIAMAGAENVVRCDSSCEYISSTLELERWKALPAAERPLVQPIYPTIIDDSWQTYTQTVLGLSFRYAQGLEIIDPFAEINLDESTLFDEAIIIRREGSALEEVMKIELFPYTTSGDLPFNNWEAIQDQLNRARNPLHRFQYRLLVPIEWKYLARHVDDIVHTQDQAPYYRIETFWISKDGIVFRITSSYPPMAQLAAGIVSTIEFDTAQLEKVRGLGIFAGDERAMAAQLVEAWANPLPTTDPQATATPIPTMTPRPTAIPTPAIRATVTPSAFDSPLVNDLQQYHGISNDLQGSPYRLLFDPSTWQWVANEEGMNYLTHQDIAGCELAPGTGVYEVPPLAPVELAGQEWDISYLARRSDEATALLYSVGWGSGYFQAILSLSEPLPDPYDPTNKSQCQRDAEAILDTFTYQVVPTTSTPAPPNPNTLLPTVTPMPYLPTPYVTPVMLEPQLYEGHALTDGLPAFEIRYDAALWELTEGRTGMNYLVHRTIENCKLDLVGTKTEATLIASTMLSGYSYSWAVYQIDLHSFIYSTTHPNWQAGPYMFNVTYPEPLSNGLLFHEIEESDCRLQVEDVIDTFFVLEEGMPRRVPVP